MTSEALARKLGGERVLRRDVHSEHDLVEAIHDGLPTRAVDEVLRAELLEPAELYRLVVPRRTLAHRKEKRQRLTPEQSDRLTRVVRVVARAEEALNDRAKAARWLRKPNRSLNGAKPIELLDSDIGARMVERVLGRIEHGVYT